MALFHSSPYINEKKHDVKNEILSPATQKQEKIRKFTNKQQQWKLKQNKTIELLAEERLFIEIGYNFPIEFRVKRIQSVISDQSSCANHLSSALRF